MKKFFIKTYGCQMNEYDSSRIADLFTATISFTSTENPEEADIIILNTCSIRERAVEKLFSDIGRFRLLKQKNPRLILAVGGCVASQEGEMLLKKAPIIDIVFGPQTIHRILEFYLTVSQKKEKIMDLSFPEIEKFERLPDPKTKSASAFVTIMEGCDNFCSYCIVPYTRGKEISRTTESILKEIQTLTQQGVKEITLLGQNVNHYCDPITHASLSQLIPCVASMPEIDSIRFMTSHPLFFTDDLIATYRNQKKLANTLHLPVQSGSNRILEQMKRGYSVEYFKERIQKMRAVRPDIQLSTDFIVGFPGETEQNFEETLQLVRDIRFDHSYNFIYSPRPGTVAAQWKDSIPLAIKKERLARLQQTMKEKSGL